jgi:hypothetical protein
MSLQKNFDLLYIRDIIRTKIANVIDFANAWFKVIYDSKHKSLAFNTSDRAYLRLHHEYYLSEKGIFKLFNQRFDSYVIKRKIENAVYELILSQNARIYLVIFITQLKSAKDDLDSFNKSRSTNSELVEMNEDTSTRRSYEIERNWKKEFAHMKKSLWDNI